MSISSQSTPKEVAPRGGGRNAGQPGGTRHAERVFRVQQAFAQLGGEAQGLADLSRASGLDDSAVYRILRSGVVHGTFVQVGRGRYRLGPLAAQLGVQAMTHAVDSDALVTCLDRLRRAADGGLTFLYGLSHLGRIQRQCVEMVVGDSDLSEIGLTPHEMSAVGRSLRVGAAGRSILAHLSEAHQRQVLATELVPKGAGPGVYRDRDKLLASLADIRAKGYAIGHQECAPGWNSYAAPVFWADMLLGSVVLLKPAPEVLALRDRYVVAIKVAAGEIGRLIGNAGNHAGCHDEERMGRVEHRGLTGRRTSRLPWRPGV